MAVSTTGLFCIGISFLAIKMPPLPAFLEEEEEFGRVVAFRSETMWRESSSQVFYLARHLPSALRNHAFTFTHRDLYRENVLVTNVVNPVINKEEYEPLDGILRTGNTPRSSLLQWTDDWPAYLAKILDPLSLKGAMMRVVFSDLKSNVR